MRYNFFKKSEYKKVLNLNYILGKVLHQHHLKRNTYSKTFLIHTCIFFHVSKYKTQKISNVNQKMMITCRLKG